MKKHLMLLILPALLVGCSEDKKPDTKKPGGLWSVFWGQPRQNKQLNVITVTNISGQALAGAKVLIGEALNSPFQNNYLETDQNGQIAIPAEWQEPQPLTIQADGYVRLTYLNQEPKTLTLKLNKVKALPTLELKGITQGHPVKNGDDIVDFGLVIEAMTRQDLLVFDINKVISPQMDEISAGGYTSRIPSNITLPKQKESYFLPITLDKPAYRLYFADRGIHRVFAAKGRFPFDKVVDQMRDKKKFFELINDFTIHGGTIRDINVTEDKTKLDIPINEINITQKRKLIAPQFRADEVMIAVAAADLNGYMIPTDVKKFNQNQKIDLGVLPEQKPLILSALKRRDEFEKQGADRVSAVLDSFNENFSPQFLPLIPDPRFAANGDLLLPKPNEISGVHPIATHTVLSEITQIQNGKESMTVLSQTWEIYANTWIDTLRMPIWPEANIQGPALNKKRWEVSFIGSHNKQNVELGSDIVEAATHVTHSSIDF